MIPPTIVKTQELLQRSNLVIPEYQRPYKWGIRHVSELLNDILHHRGKKAYRLGTLVLHTDKNTKGEEILNIVDGQQRTITLTLIALAIVKHKSAMLQKLNGHKTIGDYTPKLAKATFKNEQTLQNIRNNYLEIERRVREFDEQTIDFFFNKCELVEVRLTDISEAFQFFDSQNARGKDLEPHDLLKAFHLREMNGLPDHVKQASIVHWEAMPTKELSALFGNYLYRIRNWSRSHSARYFTKNDVHIFKGISLDDAEKFPFAQVHRIAHFYVDHYNADYNRNVDLQQMSYPFQIAETIINGKRFFEMVSHYKKMINAIKAFPKMQSDNLSLQVEKESNSLVQIFEVINSYDARNRTGDKYVRTMFDCSVLHYIDKFGTKDINRAVEKLFVIAYSLRLRQQAVQLASVDNHALYTINIFKIIRDASFPSKILNLQLQNETANNSSRTEEIKKLFIDLNYYHGN